MKKPPSPTIAARKRPRQARSTQLVDDILEAAIRVLMRDGVGRFTTVRVADEAGVSVGSLYQYFPSKAALLFRLQADEWTDTWDLISEILSDRRAPPMDRLERAVVTFFRSELEESALRAALDEVGVVLRDVPEKRALLATAKATVLAFLEEAVPAAPPASRVFAADLVMTSMVAVAEKTTEQKRSRREVDRWARATAEMFAAYLSRLGRARRGRVRAADPTVVVLESHRRGRRATPQEQPGRWSREPPPQERTSAIPCSMTSIPRAAGADPWGRRPRVGVPGGSGHGREEVEPHRSDRRAKRLRSRGITAACPRSDRPWRRVCGSQGRGLSVP